MAVTSNDYNYASITSSSIYSPQPYVYKPPCTTQSLPPWITPIPSGFEPQYIQEEQPKGMEVQINTIETIDGYKAQIVVSTQGKQFIVWESKGYKAADYETTHDNGTTTDGKNEALSEAKRAAEGQVESTLKALFNQKG